MTPRQAFEQIRAYAAAAAAAYPASPNVALIQELCEQMLADDGIKHGVWLSTQILLTEEQLEAARRAFRAVPNSLALLTQEQLDDFEAARNAIHPVIAAELKQSSAAITEALDCFVAGAPRNDGEVTS